MGLAGALARWRTMPSSMPSRPCFARARARVTSGAAPARLRFARRSQRSADQGGTQSISPLCDAPPNDPSWPRPALGEQPLAGSAATPVGGPAMLARMSAPPVRKTRAIGACTLRRPLPGFLLCVTGGTHGRDPHSRHHARPRWSISSSTSATADSALACASVPSLRSRPNNACSARCSRSTSTLRAEANRRPRFADCAERYLAQPQDMRSLEAIRIHVQLLVEHIGHLEPHQVHDATLAPLISKRIADGVCAVTINRTLEVPRTILHRAARSYRDENGRPWLKALPPLISMLPECPRSPYPITWAEQDRLFPKLPGHLARMALFAVNTGLRDANLCGLQWAWEVSVPEIGRSVFVVPAEDFKAKRPHVVILNDIAWSIIQTQRGRHPVWVFPYRGGRIARMNNSAWRRRAAKPGCARCACTICVTPARAACAPPASRPRIGRLARARQPVDGGPLRERRHRPLAISGQSLLNRQETRTVLRVANG